MHRKQRIRLRSVMYPEQNGLCPDCGRLMLTITEQVKDQLQRMATLDHIVPRSLGGEDTAENVRLVCKGCNEARDVAPLGAA